MTPVTAGKVKYGVWGLMCGAVIAMIIGLLIIIVLQVLGLLGPVPAMRITR